jgi:cleavage and polyadenylation specificity factor subunit 1
MYAILPIRQPDDEIDDTLSSDTEKSYHPSFVVKASQLEETIAHVIDEAFLHEYREPTLAVLYSRPRTAAGLLDHRKDTVSLLAIALDLQQRASTTIFSVHGLPYDCNRVLSLPSTVGGLLILGTNEVIHVDQAGRCVCVAVNVYARRTSSFPMIQKPELKLSLEGAIAVSLGTEEGDILLALRNSSFMRLRFLRDGRSVTDIDIEKLDLSTIPGVGLAGFSCAVPLASERVFLGSISGDSVLLGYISGTKAIDTSEVRIGMNDTVDDLNDIYGDEDEIAATAAGSHKSKIRLRIHDFLQSTAPIRDAILAPPVFSEVLLFRFLFNNRMQNFSSKGLPQLQSCYV